MIMKKLWLPLFLIFSIVFIALPAQANGVRIVANGIQMPMEAQAIRENGRIYVPLRYLGEALGAQAKWLSNNDNSGFIILAKGNDGVVFRMDKKDFTVIRDGHNPSLMQMDVMPLSKEGRIYLPALYVTDVFGYNLVHNEAENTIYIAQTNLSNNTTTNITTDNVNKEVDIKALAKDKKIIKGLLTSVFTLYSLMP